MSTATSRDIGTSTAAAVVAQINAFFERYGLTFADLAAGKRCDLEALLRFYDAAR